MSKKILFVLDSLKGGGFERRMSQLIIGLNKHQDQFEVCVLLPKGAPIDYTETITSGSKVFEYSSNRQFVTYIKELHPDIIHSCSPYKSLLINLLKFTISFKYIVGFIADANRPKLLSKRGLGFVVSYLFSNAIVGNSKAGLEAYRCPKSKSHVIYNGFEPQRLNIEVSDDLADLQKKNPFVVSMVARMEDDKDYITYLDFARAFKDNKSISFLIAGKGKNENALRKYCSDNSISNVSFLGFRKDVINVFKISNLSILLSKEGKHKEGISNSIMESMAVGTPVIATKDGGTLEIIDDGINGFMVEHNNLETLKSILNKCIMGDIVLTEISDKAKRTIQERFLLSRMVEDYIQLYNSL